MGATALDPSILRPRTSAKHFDYERHTVPAALADLVEHFWTVAWDLPPGRSYTAQTLPYPSVNLSVTNTEADVTGLTRRCYHRHLQGTGYAVGARFRPGCFRPLSDGPVSALTDRHRPIADVLGRGTTRLARGVAERDDPVERVELLAAFLAADWPDPDPTTAQAAELVSSIAADRGVTRVAQVAERGGLTVRSLQRLNACVRRCRAEVGGPALPPAGRGGPGRRGGRARLGGAGRRAGPRRPGAPDPGLHRHHRGTAGHLRPAGPDPLSGSFPGRRVG